MPFTLSHTAAVIPLLRSPFVPAALVMGTMAPDVPYFLQALRITLTAGAWYEPFLNATTSHSPTGALTVTLPFALLLVAAYRLLWGPVIALLPPHLAISAPAPPHGMAEKARHAAWLVLSALIGIATHLLWDSLTHVDGYAAAWLPFLRASGPGGLSVARLLQHASTAVGLAALGVHLWRRRNRPRPLRSDARPSLTRAARWSATAALMLAALLGAAAHTGGIDYYRQVTVEDTSRPIVREVNGKVTEITYPTRTENAPWATVAEGALSDAAKGAGASLAAALLVYAAGWHLHRTLRTLRRTRTVA
ncbi:MULTISPECIES: DUF4184 family protein [unclassified Streptomyces]|uniref:DUF4184 family protein n=1 Tax=unclassified Streptomyces TaxID=2593676 RepID=UPI0034353151